MVGVALIASALPIAWAQTSPPARTQTPGAEDPALAAIRADLDRVREELAAMRGELRALRELLQRLAAPSQPPARMTATVTTGDNPALGRRDAPVTIVEFSDYQCPFCRQFVTTTLPALKSTYVDAGKLRWVFRDFPLDQIHPNARKASEAARCAGEQGKYWDMHDLLFQNQQALAAEQLPTYADRLGLDRAAFGTCLNSGKYATWITAAWGPVFLQGSAKSTSGKWRAAPLPQWDASKPASGNWGGSTTAVIKGTKNPIAAAKFAEFLNTDPQTTKMFTTLQFFFPATTAIQWL